MINSFLISARSKIVLPQSYSFQSGTETHQTFSKGTEEGMNVIYGSGCEPDPSLFSRANDKNEKNLNSMTHVFKLPVKG
jgi:hypothetical protein